MMWKKYKICDIATVLSGATPATSDLANYDGEIVWITPKDLALNNSKYISRGERNLTEKGYKGCSTQLIPPYNILMSSRAPIGLLAINRTECCTNQGFKNLVIDKSICDVDFFYYYLKYHIAEVQALGSGTTFKEVSKSSLQSFVVSLPSLDEQKQIANILSTLDEKIALNRQINDNLEAMAKQLYDYWFVQFDFPNEEGKPYKSSGGIMLNCKELGRVVPEGWGHMQIKDFCKTYSGGTPKSTERSYYENGDIPWINSGELNEPYITSTNNFITQLGLDNSSAKYYPSNSVLVAMYGATAGKVSILTFEACSNQAICGVIPNESKYIYYVRFYLDSMYQHFVSISTGSARDNISQDTIKNTIVPIPNTNVLEKFATIVDPIVNRIVANLKENDNLIKQRDELLPLLMNGQVSVAQLNYHLSDD